MKKLNQPITVDLIVKAHAERRVAIRGRLKEFEDIWAFGTDRCFWEEMVYCFYTGGCSAKMGMRSLDASRPFLMDGSHEEVMNSLVGTHRYPRARARYVIATRDFLISHCGMRLKQKLDGFEDPLDRRDWLVKAKGIKGLGYKEASHYLRNVGLKGYAILDKHVLRCLHELKLISEPKPPNTRSKYLKIEETLKQFADQINIDFEEMDLVLWSLKTGEILK